MDLAPIASRLVHIDVRGLFTRNIPLKAAALAIALVVSLIAAASEPEVSGTFEGRIPVERANLPEGYVLRGSPGEVEVSYRGPQDAARKLALSSFRAEVDLAGYDLVRAGELRELPVRVAVSDQRIAIVQVRPSVVVVRLVPVQSKRMPVQVRFENQPPAGYQAAGEPSVAPAEVTVRGPADSLREVVTVIAQVRFTDAPNDVSLQPRTLAVDGAGREVAGVETQPQNVSVTVSVQAARPTRTVAVVPLIRGAPAAGFWVAGVTTEPSVVTVRGDAALLEQLDRVDTFSLDIGGATTDRAARVPLALPAGTTLARGSADVLLVISIQPARGTRSFPAVAVRAQGVGKDLVAELEASFVEIMLSGNLPTLLAIRPEQIGASIDLAGKPAGSYQVEVAVLAPSGTQVLSTTPARIGAQLRSRP